MCQGYKKWVRIKLLVDTLYREKTLLIILRNCIIKAVKDQKITKITKRTADVMVAVATAKTNSAAHITKALDAS
jgi:hypothetical protein